MIAFLDRHHGQVTGMFTGDECLAGKNPLQGTELCAVVEFMYSLEHLFSVFGDPYFGDRLERVAFNALPATFAPDMWSHQYDQQVNQVQCTINPDHDWTTNGPESNLYGLEPNFGCCTANMHQGWPKFAAHLWMTSPDGGLVAAAWAPCRVEATAQGVPVRVDVDTDYPFRDTIKLTVTPSAAVRFPLRLRVPAWAMGARVRVGTGPDEPMKPGTLHLVDRQWGAGAATLTLTFPMRPVATVRYNEAVAIERGPLVYALRIGESWTRVNADKPHRELPHGDFEVKPTTPWNYGLVLDPARPEQAVTFEERPIGDRPFSPEGAGVVARARRRRSRTGRSPAGGPLNLTGRRGLVGPGQNADRPAGRGCDAHPVRVHEHPGHRIPQGAVGGKDTVTEPETESRALDADETIEAWSRSTGMVLGSSTRPRSGTATWSISRGTMWVT